MSQEPPPDDKLVPLPKENNGEDGVEELVEHVPPQIIRDTLLAIIREGASPRIDPENFRIATETIREEQNNKLTFLMRKLEVEDSQHKRDHDLKTQQQKSTTKLLWPILVAAIVLVLGSISAGIYLAATGQETLGFSILSATVSALFSYLGGLGTPRFWKS